MINATDINTPPDDFGPDGLTDRQFRLIGWFAFVMFLVALTVVAAA